MTFNADAYLKTLEAPSIIINDVTYTGHQLSFNKTVEFQKRFEAVDTLAPDQLETLIGDVCTALGLPADKILDLPPHIALEAVNHFFTVLFGNVMTTPKKKTSGK